MRTTLFRLFLQHSTMQRGPRGFRWYRRCTTIALSARRPRYFEMGTFAKTAYTRRSPTRRSGTPVITRAGWEQQPLPPCWLLINSPGTWRTRIQAYIALTEFARNKLAEGGLPASRIFVKPNFLGSDPGAGRGNGGYALFVGRLSPEKGLETMLRAWELTREFPLKIAGDGPLAEFVHKRAAELPNVEYLGRREPKEILQLMQEATVLVFPSEWYEGLPMTIIESLACGTPVLASRVGSVIELIRNGETGYHFEAGDPEHLAALALQVFGQQSEMKTLRRRARDFYEENFTPDRNYQILLQIYEHASTKRQVF